ncbi:tryptophan synthase subunit alpha [Gilvimarinus sp. F26214L]|uniref:tryptophan synthase subunit alpha n=1 Tax=Gilvimarinus sp. DZF01 TaxID=3461371 RepID=UPI0040463865
MNRLSRRFDALKQARRKALVSYLVSGDPSPQATLPTMHKMVAEGVDIIEVGIPFSDPMAEGPTIQLAHERALVHKVSLRSTLETVKEFRESDQDTPIVLMGYDNPIERMGYELFAREAANAGVDGVIIVDLPPEEAEALNAHLKEVDIANIFLLAPTTTTERARHIVSLAGGFLYYVSLKGVTGAGHLDVDSVNRKIAEFRELTDLPICVGFGIKSGEAARAVTERADGAVVGSLFVDTMGQMAGESPEAVADAVGRLVAPIRSALDS